MFARLVPTLTLGFFAFWPGAVWIAPNREARGAPETATTARATGPASPDWPVATETQQQAR